MSLRLMLITGVNCGTTIGQARVGTWLATAVWGLYGDWLYFLAPDGWLISLGAKNGKERWRKKVADEKLQYFTTGAPLIVGNHVLVGVGGDAMDVPGYLESRDPETGDLQWRWDSEPKAGEPEAETWPDEASRTHGGGMTWLSGTYDPSLNSSTGAPAIPTRYMPGKAAKAAICGPARLWL